jgi:transcriptional regulator with XRE-family HTH domain
MDQLSKEAIARLVREGRTAKGYTQQELSELTGISLRSVQRIENAEVLPRMYTLKILADHLGFSWEAAAKEPPAGAGASEELPGEPVSLETPASSPIAQPQPVSIPRCLNKAQKIILTIGIAVFIALSILAYVAQSARFPETAFEVFVLLGVVVLVYGGIVFWIWK